MLPLINIKVIELGGLAPVPLCGMFLSDYGARVIRVDNIKATFIDDVLNRGKESVCLDLKKLNEVGVLRRLIQGADVLLDPFRPGVLEKLSLAPADLQRENPRLIVARLSGYGQVRPNDNEQLARLRVSAGHDINYLAMSGVLSCLGPRECPQPPMNLLADFAAGALACVNGILLALFQRVSSGQGQIVDCSMAQSCAYLCSFLWRGRDRIPALWPRPDQRESNVLDGGAPFYRCYQTKDGRFVAVGAIEPHFYLALLRLLAVPAEEASQGDVSAWPAIADRFAAVFATRAASDWVQAAQSRDECCVTAVLDLDEAAEFWHHDFLHIDGHDEPGPQPRLSDASKPGHGALLRPNTGQHTEAVMREIGCSEEDVQGVMAALRAHI